MPAHSNTDELGNYWCPTCQSYKPLSEFFKKAPSHRGKKPPYCKICEMESKYIARYKKKLRDVGPEVFKRDLDHELTRLKKCYALLEKKG